MCFVWISEQTVSKGGGVETKKKHGACSQSHYVYCYYYYYYQHRYQLYVGYLQLHI